MNRENETVSRILFEFAQKNGHKTSEQALEIEERIEAVFVRRLRAMREAKKYLDGISDEDTKDCEDPRTEEQASYEEWIKNHERFNVELRSMGIRQRMPVFDCPHETILHHRCLTCGMGVQVNT